MAGLLALAGAAYGCADAGSGPDSGITLLDGGHVTRDLSTPRPQPDLAMSMGGGDDGGGGMMGNCMHYDTWPNLNPQGTFDSMNMVTYVASLDTMMSPANALTIEDYVSMGEMHPKMVTYTNKDTYSQCEVCTTVAICDKNGCNDTYFAQGGTVTVTKADRSATGEMVATASNLMLVEWDFSMNGDKPVPNGRCITIGSASFDVKWGGATDGGVPADLSVAMTDGAAPAVDMAVPVDLKGVDLAKTTSDMAGVPGADMAGACHPVINELQATGATASDEWVEIYNPCNGIDFTGWKLAYRSAANNNGRSDTTLYTFPQNFKGQYLLIVGTGYAGAALPTDGWASGGLAGAGGAVALIDANGNRVDSVAYDVLTTANAFTEGAGPAPNPPAMQSIERLPNGTDTDNNSKDFKVAAVPTPKAANK